MVTFAQIMAAYPTSHIEVRPVAATIEHLPPDDWKAWVAMWFDGEHEAPALIVDADTPDEAFTELVEFIVNEAVI